jgi:hypothetical protein
LSGFSATHHAAVVFFGSMIPVTEQRATIPLGINVFSIVPFACFCTRSGRQSDPLAVCYSFFPYGSGMAQTLPQDGLFTGFLENKVRKNVHKFEKKAEWV